MRLSHRRKRDHKYKVRRHAWKSKQARAARRILFWTADSVALQTIRADRFGVRVGEALAAMGRDFRLRMGEFITKMPCHEEVERFPMSESPVLIAPDRIGKGRLWCRFKDKLSSWFRGRSVEIMMKSNVEPNLYRCPTCKGERQSFVFVNTGLDSSQHYSEIRQCDRCMGAGYVSKAVIDAIENGKRLRKARVDRGLTLREAALQEGVSVATISKREYGYL